MNLTWSPRAGTMPEPAPPPEPWSPTRPEPPYPPQPKANLHNRPTYSVEAVDALECTAPAVLAVGRWCTCEPHSMEVKRAYYEVDPDALILHDLDEAAGYRCGDTYRPEVTP